MRKKLDRLIEILNEAKAIIEELEDFIPKIERNLPAPEEILKMEVGKFGFSTRALNVLACMDVKIVGDITKYTYENLLKQHYCGKVTACEIEEKLNMFGIYLDEGKTLIDNKSNTGCPI